MQTNLTEDIKTIEEYYKIIDSMILFGFDIDGKVIKGLHSTLDHFVSLIEDKYNDNFQWISYFIYEASFGKEPKQIKINNEEYVLDSVKVFVEVYGKYLSGE